MAQYSIIKSILILTCLTWCGMAQRPSYAGNAPIGRPDLANRFRDPDAPSTAATTPSLNNRIGEDGSTLRTPVDARGDQELVDRLNQWPREHRPFWLINAEAIEASRNQQQQPQQQMNNNQNLQSRGSFQSSQQATLPVRPTNHRSSFLSPIN